MLRSTSPTTVRPVSKSSLLAMVIVSTLTLAACGGGGGGGSGSTPPPSPGAANTAPTVNAGADQSVTLPANAVDVSGSATDAENNTLTYAWSASPATGVAFTAASAAASRVTFTTAGTYTLTLTVSDGTATTTDTVQVVVNAAAAPNTAPTVNAGADQMISLPKNAVSLSGTATDAENNTLTYAWTATPATGVAFATGAAAASQVTFTDPGTYTLTLSVNDGTATTTDALQVVVNSIAWPGADVETDPNHGWTAVTNPAEVGMDEAKLAAAEAYALTGGGSGLIARGGRLVRKWGDIDKTVDLKSTTKSMGGIVLALALDESLITLNDLAQSKLPALGTAPAANPPFANDPTKLDDITIWQLATHTAGFAKDRRANVPLSSTPGTTWSYSDGGLNWLADALSNVYQRDLKVLMAERVWTPLGITNDDLLWRDLPTTNPLTADPRPPIPGNIAHREFASGIIANPNAMARVGLLYLRKGLWNNTRIIKEESAALATKPYAAIAGLPVTNEPLYPAANLNYGVLWWTNATKQLPDVPADAYWAWGLGDSLIVVIPSLDIVIARVGTGPDPSAGPYWRSEPVPNDPQGRLAPVWDGNYEILRPFLTPIVQAVTP